MALIPRDTHFYANIFIIAGQTHVKNICIHNCIIFINFAEAVLGMPGESSGLCGG